MFVSSDAGNMIPAIECTVSFKDDECFNAVLGVATMMKPYKRSKYFNSHSLVRAKAPGTSTLASRVTLSPAQRIATSRILYPLF